MKNEFYDLSATFNRMFDSLERMFVQEKQFSSNAAHELRTPISVMLSHCEYCLDELELTEETREELEIIRKKALRMSELVSQLLSITRAENKSFLPNFEEIDLVMLVKSVIEELEEKASQKDIRIELENGLDNPLIWADLGMITRMFINLIENAIIYGKRHGYVKICISEEEHQIDVKIKDNGIGIPKESLERIWERFYQVDDSRSRTKGFGLGLPMVKHIVECHGGTIKVSSKLSEGSTFSVKLPREHTQA